MSSSVLRLRAIIDQQASEYNSLFERYNEDAAEYRSKLAALRAAGEDQREALTALFGREVEALEASVVRLLAEHASEVRRLELERRDDGRRHREAMRALEAQMGAMQCEAVERQAAAQRELERRQEQARRERVEATAEKRVLNDVVKGLEAEAAVREQAHSSQTSSLSGQLGSQLERSASLTLTSVRWERRCEIAELRVEELEEQIGRLREDMEAERREWRTRMHDRTSAADRTVAEVNEETEALKAHVARLEHALALVQSQLADSQLARNEERSRFEARMERMRTVRLHGGAQRLISPSRSAKDLLERGWDPEDRYSDASLTTAPTLLGSEARSELRLTRQLSGCSSAASPSTPVATPVPTA